MALNKSMLWRLAVVLLAALLLESVWPYHWPHPDFVLLVLVPLALETGSAMGAIFGFMAGVSLGLFSASSPAVAALAYGLAGFVMGFFGEYRRHLYIYYIAMALSIVWLGVFLVSVDTFSTAAPTPVLVHRWMWQVLLSNLLIIGPFLPLFRKLVGSRHSFKRLEI